MNSRTALRRELRPQGAVLPGCPTCPLFARCGGVQRQPQLFANTCFDRHCCGQPDGCQMVCRGNRHWERDLRDHGNLLFNDLPPLNQRAVELPAHVPLIDHRIADLGVLALPVVALKTSAVFRLKGMQYAPVAEDAAGLRAFFRLAPDTRIVLRGTDKDPALERYWQHRLRDRVPDQMARLGIELVVGPNFSHPLDVVRTETLANRWRQLKCLEEMQAAGLSPVPHLSAVQPPDWVFWRSYLSERPGVRFVAVEFQTGNRDPRQGFRVIDQIAGIQDAIRRPLHLIAIGGGQYTARLSACLGGFSVLDSLAFMRAVKRREFIKEAGRARWRLRWTDGLQPIDGLLRDNLRDYSAWIEEQARLGRCNRRISLN